MMRFSLRIFLGFFLLVGILALLAFLTLRDEVRPVVRQSVEEVLVDTSHLLAEIVRDDLVDGRIDDGRFAAAIARLGARDPDAMIRGVGKRRIALRVYVTDANGIVRYDSRGTALGKDYSQWRDVYLTLRGRYGARTTREDDDDPLSGWMYVAAPVIADGHVIGVVSIGKPSQAIMPYVVNAESRLVRGGIAAMVGALLVGALFSWWLSRGIGRLTAYARAVRDGKRVAMPTFVANRELAQLAQALDEMRASLDGKEYIEEYVLGLTHELKSPLAGMAASAELLQDDLPEADRRRFAGHVGAEAERLRMIVDRLLELVRLEQRQVPRMESVSVREMLDRVCAALEPQAGTASIHLGVVDDVTMLGEAFLLEQALRNLVQNALAFSDAGTRVQINARRSGDEVRISIENTGEDIPEWAMPRVFERFYSLPREGQRKGSGLGLPLVRTIAALHGGCVSLENSGTGVRATLTLPLR